jgi:hypothetical protein
LRGCCVNEDLGEEEVGKVLHERGSVCTDIARSYKKGSVAISQNTEAGENTPPRPWLTLSIDFRPSVIIIIGIVDPTCDIDIEKLRWMRLAN